MNKTIWKYEIPYQLEFPLELHKDAVILCVHAQGQDKAYMWVESDTDRGKEVRHFRIITTGRLHYQHLEYIGTFFLMDGEFVGHLYERLDNDT
jgi:hypothetical protein